MSITSSEPSFERGYWLCEKSSQVLAAACRLVDELTELGDALVADHPFVTHYLDDIISHATQLSAFGHGKLDAFTPELAKLMMAQGWKGFRIYREYVNKTNPLAADLRSLERLLPLLDQVQKRLTSEVGNIGNKEVLLGKLGELAKALCTNPFVNVQAIGEDLQKLIKCYDAKPPSWSSLIKATTPLIQQSRQTVVQSVVDACNRLADLDVAYHDSLEAANRLAADKR